MTKVAILIDGVFFIRRLPRITDRSIVPAAKLARREGARVILDPLWQNVASDLFEHIDQVHCPFPRPGRGTQP